MWNLHLFKDADVPYPVSNAYDLYGSLPNAKRDIVVIPGAPHFLSWTHAQQVNDVTVHFLDRITGVDSEALAKLPLSTFPPYATCQGNDRALCLADTVQNKKSF